MKTILPKQVAVLEKVEQAQNEQLCKILYKKYSS